MGDSRFRHGEPEQIDLQLTDAEIADAAAVARRIRECYQNGTEPSESDLAKHQQYGLTNTTCREVIFPAVANLLTSQERGRKSAILSPDEKRLAVAARDSLVDDGLSKVRASEQIGAKLRTGTFKGINRAVEIEDDTIRRW